MDLVYLIKKHRQMPVELYPQNSFWNFAGPEGKTPANAGVFFNLYLRVYAAMHNDGKTPYRPPPDTPLILFHWGYF